MSLSQLKHLSWTSAHYYFHIIVFEIQLTALILEITPQFMFMNGLIKFKMFGSSVSGVLMNENLFIASELLVNN